jgi:hypothetical protein
MVIALVQVALIAGVAGKLLYDRHALPRVWAQTTGVDPVLPIRGRYVSLRLIVDSDAAVLPGPDDEQRPAFATAELSVRDNALHATVIAQPRETFLGWQGQDIQLLNTPAGPTWCLAEPVAFFLPEGAADPTRLAPGEVLWAEVTIPPQGPPRPIRLEVRR